MKDNTSGLTLSAIEPPKSNGYAIIYENIYCGTAAATEGHRGLVGL